MLFYSDQRDFPWNTEGGYMTASNRINSNTNLYVIDETDGHNADEANDFLVPKGDFDRQTQTHYSSTISSVKIQLYLKKIRFRSNLVSTLSINCAFIFGKVFW